MGFSGIDLRWSSGGDTSKPLLAKGRYTVLNLLQYAYEKEAYKSDGGRQAEVL